MLPCSHPSLPTTFCSCARPSGSHILSGNVFEPRALTELLPEWRDDPDCPIRTPAKKDRFMLLTKSMSIRLPTPPQMKNKGNYIISLRWAPGVGWASLQDALCVA